MSQSKRKRTDDRSEKKAPGSRAIDRERPARWPGFIIISLVIVVILIVVGIFYYQEYVAPFRRAIITVDGITIDTGYFLKRTQLAGADPISMLEPLTNELVIKLEAPNYGIKVGPQDIDQALKMIASGGSGNITDSEVKEWYRQQLNESGLSDSEYRDLVEGTLLSAGLNAYLAERLPTVAEQVYLHAIITDTYEDAVKAQARLEQGEDFADVAREMSVDSQSAEEGGDIGWVPRGIMDSIDYGAFDLNVGEVSAPLGSEDETSFYLFMVSEKADAREIDEEYLAVLKSRALELWLPSESQFHKISYNFNSEIYAWLNWQMTKKSTTGTSSSN